MQDFEVEKETSILQETERTMLGGVGTIKSVFLIFRSLCGIAVLTMPHQIYNFGVPGSLLVFPMITIGVIYSINCMIEVANDLHWYGEE